MSTSLLEPHRLHELESLIVHLLELKDTDFSKFINSSNSATILKPFCLCLHGFWSSNYSNQHQIDSLILKFLLRLCPSFNSRLQMDASTSSKSQKQKKAVICSKAFLDCLFETDPLGLLVYLYSSWHPSDLIDLIRDELVPASLIKSIKQKRSVEPQQATIEGFLNWITKSTPEAPLKIDERESILRRFEYESDDDFLEDDRNDDSSEQAEQKQQMDPVQFKLFSLYTSNPAVFSRTSQARKLPQRISLAADTKLSHEQIEGWALMLERNPKKLHILQDFIFHSKMQKNKT